jgi:hypothetical protein
MEQFVELEMARETKYSDETCPGDILYTTNPTSFDLGSNPNHHMIKLIN